MLRQPRPLVPFALERRVFNPYRAKVLATQPAHLLAYWPLDDASGSAAKDASGSGRDGAYTSVSLAAATFLDGLAAPAFNGASSFVNIYAAISAVFNSGEGSVQAWSKNPSAFWTDGLIDILFNIGVDSNNFVRVIKGAGNTLSLRYSAGGTSKIVNASGTPTAWTQYVITWSKSADEVKGYVNGTQSSTTQTGLGTWSGSLSSSQTVIGALNTSAADDWYDNIARVALWDTPLSASEIANLATVP